jgi:predicted transcriptional regulator
MAMSRLEIIIKELNAMGKKLEEQKHLISGHDEPIDNTKIQEAIRNYVRQKELESFYISEKSLKEELVKNCPWLAASKVLHDQIEKELSAVFEKKFE